MRFLVLLDWGFAGLLKSHILGDENLSIKNQVLKAIHHRRSVRGFTGESIAAEDLGTVLEAGRWASSGLNSQPGPSIVVKKQDKKHDEVKGT